MDGGTAAMQHWLRAASGLTSAGVQCVRLYLYYEPVMQWFRFSGVSEAVAEL
jgi:hypothetical protein